MSAPGWYADPQDPSSQRYFDGQSWTEHHRPAAAAPPAPLAWGGRPQQPPQPAQRPATGPQGWDAPTQQQPGLTPAPTQGAWHAPAPAAPAPAAPAPAAPAPAAPAPARQQPAWHQPAWQPPAPAGAYPTQYPTATWQQPAPASGYPGYPPAGRRRRNRPLILGLGTILAVGLLTGGYFVFLRGDSAPSLTFDGAKIKNVSAVLTGAEANVAAIVTRRHGAKSDATRCYYAVPRQPASGAKKTDVDPNLRCGPVLFVDGDAAKQYLSFELTKSGSGNSVTLTAASTPRDTNPDAAPADMKLQRPDGKNVPASGEHLAVPQPPAAAKGALLASDLGSTAPPAQIDGAEMVSLNTGVRLVSGGVVARYGHGDDARSAAPGEQLIAFQTADVPGEKDNSAAGSHVTVSVHGAAARPLPAADSTDTYVIMSVPTGAEASLVLSDAGYVQTLSLPKGTPGAQNLTVLNRTHRSFEIGTAAAVPVSISDGANSAHVVFQTKGGFAGLDFWVPAHEKAHPAKTGDALLSVSLTYTDPGEPGKTFGWDAPLLKLKLPGGRTVAARNIAAAGKVFNVFEVPASFTTGTVIITGSERSSGITLAVSKSASFKVSFPAG